MIGEEMWEAGRKSNLLIIHTQNKLKLSRNPGHGKGGEAVVFRNLLGKGPKFVFFL